MIRILALQKFSDKKVNQLQFFNPQIVFRTVVIEQFLTSREWRCPPGVTSIEYLVVGGGGGGALARSYQAGPGPAPTWNRDRSGG